MAEQADLAAFDRAAEVLRLNSLSADAIARMAGDRLRVDDDVSALYVHFARSVASAVSERVREGGTATLILPWGPIEQYPVLGNLLVNERISLRDSTLFFMDEYADTSGEAVSDCHPLSFRGAALRWIGTLPESIRPIPSNVVFPNERNASSIEHRIEDLGGVDVCFGGIGIHGHIAFNEPEPGVSNSGVRLTELNQFTRTINAIRAGVGGDLENFPQAAWTLGIRQCLSARRVELYCRSDFGLDWAKTVLRLALCGTPGDDYPVTWIRRHPNYRIVTDRATLRRPLVRLP